MKSAIVGLAACLAVAVSPGLAYAQQTGGAAAAPQSGQPAAATPVANSDKMVCKSEAVIGSRFAKKICMTAAQWQQQEQDAKKMLERLQGARTPDQG